MTTTLRALTRPVLTVAGLVLIVVAASLVTAALGFLAAGLGCLVVEWLVTE